MERPAAGLVVALIAAAAAACGGEAADALPPGALTPGEALPSAWRPLPASGGTSSVVWIFRTDDCLSCQAMDYSLRRLQAAYGGRVALVAVHVGRGEDASIPAAFFAGKRLETAAAVDVSPRAFRRAFGDVTLPVLLLARGDTVAWSSVAPGEPRLTAARIDSVFATELGRGGSARPVRPARRAAGDSSSHPSSAEARS